MLVKFNQFLGSHHPSSLSRARRRLNMCSLLYIYSGARVFVLRCFIINSAGIQRGFSHFYLSLSVLFGILQSSWIFPARAVKIQPASENACRIFKDCFAYHVSKWVFCHSGEFLM
jgi:hypothetical protein